MTRSEIIAAYHLEAWEKARTDLDTLKEQGVLLSEMGSDAIQALQAQTDYLDTVLQELALKRTELAGVIEAVSAMSKQSHQQLKYASITFSQLQKQQ